MASELATSVAMAVARNPRTGVLVTTTVIATLETGVLVAGGAPPLLTAAITAAVGAAGAVLWWVDGSRHRRLILDVLAAESPAPEPEPDEIDGEGLEALLTADLRRVRDASAARREVEALSRGRRNAPEMV